MKSDPAEIRRSLEAKRRTVDAELERILAGDGSRLFEAMRYAVSGGGKRYRPLLLLSAGEAFEGSEAGLLPYACAIELIHSYSLVHDDLPAMDNDDFRRGRPSCHKAFGEGLALLAGDGLLSLAFEILCGAPAPVGDPGRKDRAVGRIAAAAGVRGMIKGQWMDISFSPGEADERIFLDLVGKKTGALIAASASAGALLAGVPPAGLQAIDEFGMSVGLAFQFRDDIADAGTSGSPSRLDAVALLGPEGARERLEGYVDAAVRALDRGKIGSEALRHLARALSLEGGR
jgi:geranylgeranyl diphosphate synthase type II